MSDHYEDGAREVDHPSYVGRAPACGCDRLFESKEERSRHIGLERYKERQERIDRALAWLDKHEAWGWLFAGLLIALACTAIWVASGFPNLWR